MARKLCNEAESMTVLSSLKVTHFRSSFIFHATHARLMRVHACSYSFLHLFPSLIDCLSLFPSADAVARESRANDARESRGIKRHSQADQKKSEINITLCRSLLSVVSSLSLSFLACTSVVCLSIERNQRKD